MKQFVLGFLILNFSMISKAQTEKNTWLLGGSAGFSSSSFGDIKETEIAINPNFGYFVVDNIAVGLSAIISSISPDIGDGTTSYALGSGLRYYFTSIGSNSKLFANGSAAIGRAKTGSDDALNITAWSISAGPAIFLNKNIAIEMMIGYSSTKVEAVSDPLNIISVAVGFQFHFKK